MTKIADITRFNLFTNNNDKIMFFKSKNEKVKADYNLYDREGQLSVKGIKATSAKAPAFIKLSMEVGEGDSREFARGALFPSPRKTSKAAPDMTGKLECGEVSKRLAAWHKKSDKCVEYISIAITAFEHEEAKEADAQASASASPDAVAAAEAHVDADEHAHALEAEDTDSDSDRPVF